MQPYHSTNGRVMQGNFGSEGIRVLPMCAHQPGNTSFVAQTAVSGQRAAGCKSGVPSRHHTTSPIIRLVPEHLILSTSGAFMLPKVLMTKAEKIFGQNISDVRVHISPQVPALNARAVTTGNNIYFAPGRYDPSSRTGQELIGHELAHVMQQRSGRVRNPFGRGLAVVEDRTLEQEARYAGQQLSGLLQMSVGTPPLRGGVPIQAMRSSGVGEDAAAKIKSRFDAIFRGETVYPEAMMVFPNVNILPGNRAAVTSPQSAKLAITDIFQDVSTKRAFNNLPTAEGIASGLRGRLSHVSTPDRRKIVRDPNFAEDVMLQINMLSMGKPTPLYKVDYRPFEMRHTRTSSRLWRHVHDTISAMRFTVRHYTVVDKSLQQPPYNEIKSSLELKVIDNIGGKHTNNKDWNTLGNIGYVFALLTINGNIPKRKFLSDSTHYAEFNLEALQHVFVSGDLLQHAHKDKISKVNAYKGTGSNIKKQLCIIMTEYFVDAGRRLVTADDCVELLDRLYENFEVKIPHNLKVTIWKQK